MRTITMPPQSKPGHRPDDPLKRGLAKVDSMIAAGRLVYPVASQNLQHWLDGRGRDRVLPATSFATQTFFIDHLVRKHRPKFVAGAERRLAGKEVEPGRPFEMEWTDSVVAPALSDFYFALGGFTVHSRVKAQVAVDAARATLRFLTWQGEISDDYDWDAGKSTLIPGIGRVTDDEMLAMERAGYGMAYKIKSAWATIADSNVTAEVAIALGR